MEVHVVSSTPEAFRVSFRDPKSGLQMIIGISTKLIADWGLRIDQLLPTVTVLADEILMNHDLDKPIEPEYFFSETEAKQTLTATVDWIREVHI